MFCDDVSGVGLWLPTNPTEPHRLPMSRALADEVQAWVDHWTQDFDHPDFDEEAHDWTGHALSQRIQGEIGPAYRVIFQPSTATVEAALRRSKP